MINAMEFIPVTEASYPFAAADIKCKFSDIGYVEDEYFVSGTANVYTEKNGQKEVLLEGAPYTTRLLIRRPERVESFSGNVVVEILNASAMMDIDRMWVNSWEFFTRNGDIYIGISSKGHVVDALKRFDPERYAPICWDNPLPDRTPPEEDAAQFMFLPEYESGLFWDMLTDLAHLLRKEGDMNPIAQYGENVLYLTGWSQSGSYLMRYLKSFAYRPEVEQGRPVFDGYLAAGSGVEPAPINAYELSERMLGNIGVPKGNVAGAKEPFICVNTESENRNAFWYGDFDQPDFKFRTYQISGSSHDSYNNLVEYYKGRCEEDVERIGGKIGYDGVDGEAMDYPYEGIFNASFYHLYRWVREGIPAPHAPKIETEITGPEMQDPFGAYVRNRTDAFGNAKGGIRTAAIDYPIGTYSSHSVDKDGRIIPMFGKVNPFSAELLKELYGDLNHYRELVAQRTDEVIAQGFILPEDRETHIEAVVALAARRGLE